MWSVPACHWIRGAYHLSPKNLSILILVKHFPHQPKSNKTTKSRHPSIHLFLSIMCGCQTHNIHLLTPCVSGIDMSRYGIRCVVATIGIATVIDHAIKLILRAGSTMHILLSAARNLAFHCFSLKWLVKVKAATRDWSVYRETSLCADILVYIYMHIPLYPILEVSV